MGDPDPFKTVGGNFSQSFVNEFLFLSCGFIILRPLMCSFVRHSSLHISTYGLDCKQSWCLETSSSQFETFPDHTNEMNVGTKFSFPVVLTLRDIFQSLLQSYGGRYKLDERCFYFPLKYNVCTNHLDSNSPRQIKLQISLELNNRWIM